jgi:alkyldihydroxyacetonephosphate synthase
MCPPESSPAEPAREPVGPAEPGVLWPSEPDVPAGAIRPPRRLPAAPSSDAESPDAWGFRDTAFRINERGHAVLGGQRYALCGQELPDFLPWVRRTFGVPLDAGSARPSRYPPPVPEPVDNREFRAELEKFLPPQAMSSDPELRLRRGHGHALSEIHALRYGSLSRVPDWVLFPRDEAEVERIVQAAQAHGACLIPYGGGTNVSEALRCPPGERRLIACVDLRELDQLLWLDPRDHAACIQAGAVGRNIAAQLREHGFTLGHEPDSLEHSTLGGWIATHASGMKKNRYGNIEDLVLDLEVVTARGRLQRARALPRESTGLAPSRWLFGSEGNLGIVTRAVLKIFPLPELQQYDSALFPDFESGVAFMRELATAGPLPASVRLLDNLQFQFGQALRPRAAGGLAALRKRAERAWVTRVRGFAPEQLCACTFVFEGSRAEVREQRQRVARLLRRHGGLRAGAENGRRGYQLTFSIAYIRDFALSLGLLAESFETSVPWSLLAPLCARVKQRLAREHAARQLPGKLFASCRVTQVYTTGACVYFYFAFCGDGVQNPAEVHAELERAARDEVLRAGGSLSHHHGVGKLRQRFLPQIMSPASLEWAAALKQAVDPANVFGVGNLWRP